MDLLARCKRSFSVNNKKFLVAISLLVVLLSGVFVLAREGNFNIFASGSSNVTITVRDNAGPVLGARVAMAGQSGQTNISGQVSFLINYSSSENYTVEAWGSCYGSTQVTVNDPSESATINLNCGGGGDNQTPGPTATATISETSTATPYDANPPIPPAGSTFTVDGEVRDMVSRDPIPGANVSIAGKTAVTDSLGHFVVSGIVTTTTSYKWSNFELSTRKDGWIPDPNIGRLDNLLGNVDRNIIPDYTYHIPTPINLRRPISGYFSLDGNILDTDQNPFGLLNGVMVRLKDSAGNTMNWTYSGGVGNSDGHYSMVQIPFNSPATSAYTIEYSKDGTREINRQLCSYPIITKKLSDMTSVTQITDGSSIHLQLLEMGMTECIPLVSATPTASSSATVSPSLTPTASASASASDTLYVSLTAKPIQSYSPGKITLAATVSGSATGTINYYFWWNCEAGGADLDATIRRCGNPESAEVGKIFHADSDPNKKISRKYQKQVGADWETFRPKVLVERGSLRPAYAGALFSLDSDPELTTYLPILVLDTKTLNPLPWATVSLFDCPIGSSQSSKTELYGVAKFVLPNEEMTCRVEATYHGKIVNKQINIPKNLNSLGRDEKLAFYDQFILYIDYFNINDTAIRGGLTIKVVDDVTGQPIPNAKLDIYSPIESRAYDSPLHGTFPLRIGREKHTIVRTNSSGIAVIDPRSIHFDGHEKKFFLFYDKGETQGLSAWDSFNIKITASGYDPAQPLIDLADNSFSPGSPYTVRLERSDLFSSVRNVVTETYQAAVDLLAR